MTLEECLAALSEKRTLLFQITDAAVALGSKGSNSGLCALLPSIAREGHLLARLADDALEVCRAGAVAEAIALAKEE